MRKNTRHVVAAAITVLSVSGVVHARPAPPDGPPPATAPAELPPVKGRVEGLNYGANGTPNGLLIRVGDGPLTQVNFPPHMADAVGKAAATGTIVTAAVRPLPPRPPRPDAGRPKPPAPGDDAPPPPPPEGKAKPPAPGDVPPPEDKAKPPAPGDDAPPPPVAADHPVFELVSLTPETGPSVDVVRPDAMPVRRVEGKVVRLNYAREGQVDGAVLDNGTFVHVGPREANELNLAVGQALRVEGTTPPAAGDKVIHATKVNDTEIERPAPGPKGPLRR